MRVDECHRPAKLVPRERNNPKHNAGDMNKIRTLGERLLQVKGLKLQQHDDTRISNDESTNEGLYNEMRAWKSVSCS